MSESTGIDIQFKNTPEPKSMDLPKECLCEGCHNANLTPFKVRTCDHVLCGPCWQRSAFNIGINENRCLICSVKTDLLCFNDYRRFIGHNLYKAELIPAHGDLLQSLDKIKDNLNDRLEGIIALENSKKQLFEYLWMQVLATRNWLRNREQYRAEKAEQVYDEKLLELH